MANGPGDDFAAVFGAVAHEARREILVELAHLGDALPSGYLAKRAKGSWPTTTRHLAVLLDAGLVDVVREGRTSIYHLNRERMHEVLTRWLDVIRPRTPIQTWAPTGPRTSAELQRRIKPTSKRKPNDKKSKKGTST